MYAVSIICRSAVTGWVPSRQAHLMIAFFVGCTERADDQDGEGGSESGLVTSSHFACGLKYEFLQLEGIPKLRQLMLSSGNSAEVLATRVPRLPT